MAKVRVELTKGEPIRYISHLDYAGAIEKAIRRARIPIAYSEGFNPHMKMAFASALAVGVTSDAEYMDIELKEEVQIDWLMAQLKAVLPPGIILKRAKYIEQRSQALMAIVNLATYTVTAPLAAGADFAAAERAVLEFNNNAEVLYTKESPKGKREINVKQYIERAVTIQQTGQSVVLDMVIRITPTGSVKPGEVLIALVNTFGLTVAADAALINRTGLYTADKKLWLSPIEL